MSVNLAFQLSDKTLKSSYSNVLCNHIICYGSLNLSLSFVPVTLVA